MISSLKMMMYTMVKNILSFLEINLKKQINVFTIPAHLL